MLHAKDESCDGGKDNVLLLLYKTTNTTHNDAAFQNYKVTLTNYIQQSSALEVTIPQPVTTLLEFYGTLSFTTVFTIARYLFLYSARRLQSMHFNIIIPTTPRSPSLFPSGSPTDTSHAILTTLNRTAARQMPPASLFQINSIDWKPSALHHSVERSHTC